MMPGQQQPNQPVTIDAVMALLRDGALRRFRIDIEVDSTIVGDESQERKDRNDFIASVTQFMQGWGPMVQANPALAPLAGDLLLFGVRAYRVGRELEETIEDTVEKIEQLASQPKPPSPEIMAAQAKAQSEQVKAKAEVQKSQFDVQAAQVGAQAKIAQAHLDHHTAMRQAQMDEQRAQNDFIRQQAEAANAAMMPPGANNV